MQTFRLQTTNSSKLSCEILQTHHKHFLHSGDALAEYGTELISYTGQKEAEQRYPQQRVDNAEDPSTFCVRRDVPKTCRGREIYHHVMLSHVIR